MKESIDWLDTSAAKQRLEELEAERAALLDGPASQVDLVECGDIGVYIQCLDASGASLRSPVLDIEDQKPAVGDTVAVTGFVGSVWWAGTFEVIAW